MEICNDSVKIIIENHSMNKKEKENKIGIVVITVD